MLRASAAAILLALVTIVFLPIQAFAVALKRPIRRRLPQAYHRLACRLIGLNISVVGRPPEGPPALIVANHSSWIDISAISATTPVVFVAKSEIAAWPIFGVLAKLQRSVFVDRGRRSGTRTVNAEMADRLVGGDHVVLFAEGTSSDGCRLLPFRSALIGAAGDALLRTDGRGEIVIQPLSVVYTRLHGIPIGRPHRYRAAWCGSTPLLPHLAGVLSDGSLDVTLTWGEPIAYTRDCDRKQTAKQLEAVVRALSVAARLQPAS